MIAAVFLLKLCAGITLMWWLMPRRDVTDGFFRIQMRLLLGLSVLTVLLFSTITPTGSTATDNTESPVIAGVPVHDIIRWLHIGACVTAYAGSVFWALGRRLPGNICIHILGCCCVGSLILLAVEGPTESHFALRLFADLSTSAVVGGVLTGMLLGHWYLTTPTMSIQPLWWFTWAIGVAAGLRLAASTMALATHGAPEQSIWLIMRWAGGIVAPLVTMFLVARILKHRNTQSATGVLFAGLILVFMGEMTATLLEQETGISF